MASFPHRLRRRARALVLSACGALTAGCVAGAKLREDAQLIEKKIANAREAGAYRCGPNQLATAESNLEFLQHELSQGDYRRAEQHHRIALKAIEEALAVTDPNQCADKRVLIMAGTDRDADGINDEVDQCPDEPEDIDTFQDEDGCPEPDNDLDTVLDVSDKCPFDAGDPALQGCPVPDRDADGVPDDRDQCPDIPEDLDGNMDSDGCPEEDNSDRDGDTILDKVDRCPDEPEDLDQFQDEDGCPDPDNDLDTVLDVVDACPLQPGPVEQNGCPVVDRDADGITDDLDQCPDVPGDPPKGCPKRVLVVKTDTRIEIKEMIAFETGKAKIKGKTSFETLDQVAAVLKSNPAMKIVIEGHTDDRGSAAGNLKLSDDRAHAVREALIERGTDPGRIEAIGYGESKPIASNRSTKGRAANRRVEFKIVDNTPAPAPEAAPAPVPVPTE